MKILLSYCWIPVVLLISGCNEEMKLFQWIEDGNRYRAAAVYYAGSTPYRRNEHKAFKEYFSHVERLAFELKTEGDLAPAYQGVVSSQDLRKMCSKVLISHQRWTQIMRHCQKNRFFLCAEEVKAYSDAVNVLRESLSDDQKRRFDQTSSCQDALPPGP